jgi:hypothetical protein
VLVPRASALGFGAFLVCYSVYMLARPGLVVRARVSLFDAVVGFEERHPGRRHPLARRTAHHVVQSPGTAEGRAALRLSRSFSSCRRRGSFYFSRVGMLGAGLSSMYLPCAPLVLLGTWIGLGLFDRMKDKRFQRVVLVFLLVSGGGVGR